MLQASCTPGYITALTAARAQSVLDTAAGQSLKLPLSLDPEQTRLAVEGGTLHLDVPEGFMESDLNTLAWLMTDRLAFQSATRFHSSIVAGRKTNLERGHHSFPRFTFPFSGQPEFKLHGVWIQPSDPKVFLALHIERCDADFPMPSLIENPRFPATQMWEKPPVGPGPQPVPGFRGTKPSLDDEPGVDSLIPPDKRLTTLVLSLKQNRFGTFKKTRLASQPDQEVKPGPHMLGVDITPVTVVSSGEKEPGGEGGRHLYVGEKMPDAPIPSRRVDHFSQFSDLIGVCEELRKHQIESDFLALNRADESDPTTPIPASAGAAARWVGEGVTARRALIARLTQKDRIAYALEWERFNTDEYGKLLLVSAGTVNIAPERLLTLLKQCADGRGVWPNSGIKGAVLDGLVHRKPHREIMSAQICKVLKKHGWEVEK